MPLTDNLVAYWKLDDSGTQVDSYGANNLTNNNSVGSAAGKIGSASAFNATAGQSLTSSGTGLRIQNGSATINMWVKVTTERTYSLFATKTEGNGKLYYLYRYGDAFQQLRLEYTDTASAKAFNNTVFGALAVNAWYMITLRFDLTGNETALFINGGSKTASTFSGFGTNVTGETSFMLGNDPGNDGCIGLIDECGFWNRALSDAELVTLYNGGAGLPYAAFLLGRMDPALRLGRVPRARPRRPARRKLRLGSPALAWRPAALAACLQKRRRARRMHRRRDRPRMETGVVLFAPAIDAPAIETAFTASASVVARVGLACTLKMIT